MAALSGLLGVRLPSRPQCALPAVATSALLVTTAFGWLEMFTLAGVAGWGWRSADSWPWRASCQLLTRLCARMPFAEAGKMLMPVVFIVAGVVLVREDAPPEQVLPALVLLAGVAIGAFVAPFVDAAFSRASERRADSYAALLGRRELPAVQL